MVTHPRTATRARSLLPLNLPRPLRVETDRAGRPAAVSLRGDIRPVVAIADHWRIDDEWWREEISRDYLLVELEGGRRVTVFHDLSNGGWFQQHYTPPLQIRPGA